MKTFLVALDDSPMAPRVLAEAKRHAEAFGAKLLLLRAVGLPAELPLEAYAMSPDAVADLLLKKAREDLHGFAGEVAPERLDGVRVELGVPWRVICDIAEQTGSAMVIVGAHGHKWFDRVLGTTTSRVVSHTECPTLIVRAEKGSGRK